MIWEVGGEIRRLPAPIETPAIDAHLVSHLFVWSSKFPYTWKKIQYLSMDGCSKDM